MGLLNMLFIGVLLLIFVMLIGGVIGIVWILFNKVFWLVGMVYVEVFCNIFLIVQVFFWYVLVNCLLLLCQVYEFVGGFLINCGFYLLGVIIVGWLIFVLLVLLVVVVLVILVLYGLCWFWWVEFVRKCVLSFGIVFVVVVVVLVVGWVGYIGGVQIMIWFVVCGLNIQGGYCILLEIYVLVFVIVIYGGVYVVEIVCGGFNVVSKGQVEVVQLLGLMLWLVFFCVWFLLVFCLMLLILINQYVWLIKVMILGIIVGFVDFFMVVNVVIIYLGQIFELVGLLMVMFLIINFMLVVILNCINKVVVLKGYQLRG